MHYLFVGWMAAEQARYRHEGLPWRKLSFAPHANTAVLAFLEAPLAPPVHADMPAAPPSGGRGLLALLEAAHARLDAISEPLS